MTVLVNNFVRPVRTAKYYVTNNTRKNVRSMCHVGNCFDERINKLIKPRESHNNNKLQHIPVQEVLAGYWKSISAAVRKKFQFWTAEEGKYDRIASKTNKFHILHDGGGVAELHIKGNPVYTCNNELDYKIDKEFTEDLKDIIAAKEKTRRDMKTVKGPLKRGNFNVSFDGSKLIIDTQKGETYTFNHSVDIKVIKELTENLQNEINDEEEDLVYGGRKFKSGNYDVSRFDGEITYKTEEYTETFVSKCQALNKRYSYSYDAKEFARIQKVSSIIGNFNISLVDGKIIVRTQKTDETFIFTFGFDIKVDKKLVKSLQNETAAEELSPKDKTMNIFVLGFHSGEVLLATAGTDDCFVMKHFVIVKMIENGAATTDIDVFPAFQAIYKRLP